MWHRWLAAVLITGTAACSGSLPPTQSPAQTATTAATVTWHDWSPASFQRAHSERRILLVNVAARWCHWCHVMDETTYADPEVAALLQAHFVTIRVDADARPDLAERYAAWGWPATAILTSEAQPVLELRGFHEPRTFAKLLRDLVAKSQAGRLHGRQDPPPAPPRADTDLAALRTTVYAQLDRFYDPVEGGWGRKQKYPLAALDELALLRGAVFAEPTWTERAVTTLTGERNLLDPVWGGMFQYSVAGVWDRPHYEKIGMIQAGAVEAFALVYRRTGTATWRDLAHLQRNYLLLHMQAPDGGFYTSQDADLRREGQPPVLGADYYAKSDADRRALGMPRTDRARHADINGRTISALCRLVAAVPGPDGEMDDTALTAALAAAGYVVRELHDGRGGYFHSADDQTLLHLRDQAAVGLAFLDLHAVTFDPTWLDRARQVATVLAESFEDREHGGFFAHTPDPAATGVFAVRRRPVEDNALAVRFLLRLQFLDEASPTPGHRDRALRALRAVGDPKVLAEEGRMLGQFALAVTEATTPTIEVSVVAQAGDPAGQALHRAALGLDQPRALIRPSQPGTRYPDIGAAAVYLCTDTACSSPVRDPAKLAAVAASFTASLVP